MKRRITGIITLVGLFAVLAVAASAQTSRQLKTSVPFAFNVAGTQLPAGDYVITYGGAGISRNTIIIRSANGDGAIAALVRTEVMTEAADTNGVSFQQVNGKYYLEGISMYALKISVGPTAKAGTSLTLAAK